MRLILAAILTLVATMAMADESVTIRMCRNNQFTSLSTNKAVVVKAGYTFAQELPDHEHFAAILQVQRDTRVSPGGCATTTALVTDRLSDAPLTASSVLLQQFDDGFDLKTRVAR